LNPCSGLEEFSIACGTGPASSIKIGGERGGSGSENHGVTPPGQKDSSSVYCSVSSERVDTRVQSEEDDELDLIKK